jgi:hypothetical protein
MVAIFECALRRHPSPPVPDRERHCGEFGEEQLQISPGGSPIPTVSRSGSSAAADAADRAGAMMAAIVAGIVIAGSLRMRQSRPHRFALLRAQ